MSDSIAVTIFFVWKMLYCFFCFICIVVEFICKHWMPEHKTLFIIG